MTERDELDVIAKRLQRARANVDAVTAEAREAALRALAAGTSEVLVSQKLGVTRMTVRRWVGK
ncbi:hypothetical protein [Microbacterium dauci]|uniref:Homeodomain-like domain-containing protein n=1 Tax=Microbacterium dauci TaxID=3048008 RepID=A0ABT6ZAQ1_9MICO|nr:hypothetical protein [Microbacterium sp. LX3-4]MDJ1113245.1 hypothetical protein [Microbacterium sp. LX3-4]